MKRKIIMTVMLSTAMSMPVFAQNRNRGQRPSRSNKVSPNRSSNRSAVGRGSRPSSGRSSSGRSGSGRPGYSRPSQPSRPGYSRPQPSRPGYSRPQPSRPGYNRPKPSRPGYSKPQPSRPGYNRPKPSRPGYSKPQPSRPGYNRPKPSRPIVTRPSQPNRPGINKPSRPYYRYSHKPVARQNVGSRRYNSPRDYYRTLNQSSFFLNRYINFSVSSHNGYFLKGNYPYFVFNGSAHRYSVYDTCNYSLVDTYQGYGVQTFFGLNCRNGYDQCAVERDYLNHQEQSFRYMCAEDIY